MDRSFLSAALLGIMTVSRVGAQTPSSAPAQAFDVLIKNGTVDDGEGGDGRAADVALRGDRIAGVGDFKSERAKVVIDAHGLAVAPGFINMLSWSTESLIADGHSRARFGKE